MSATDAANQIATQPLDWEPGTRYLYSEGPIIGGAIIEVTSGMPYPQFIQQRIPVRFRGGGLTSLFRGKIRQETLDDFQW